MYFAHPLDLMNCHFFDFGDMFWEISFVDGLDIGPIIFDGEFFELGLVLIMPST